VVGADAAPPLRPHLACVLGAEVQAVKHVNSCFRLLAFGFQLLGAALCGLLIKAIGAQATVLVFSGVVLLLALLTTANTHVRQVKPIATARSA
jgi:hypothetical protein